MQRNQISNCQHLLDHRKSKSSRKTSTALLTAPKPLTVWITTNHGKFLEMGIPNHHSCLLRSLYVGQEATVRTRHGTTDWFKIVKKSTTRLYTVTLLILLIWNVHHVKCKAEWITRWNQDCWEKYKKPQRCRWYHSNGRKGRGTKESLYLFIFC